MSALLAGQGDAQTVIPPRTHGIQLSQPLHGLPNRVQGVLIWHKLLKSRPITGVHHADNTTEVRCHRIKGCDHHIPEVRNNGRIEAYVATKSPPHRDLRVSDHQRKNRFRWLPHQHDRRNVYTSRALNLSGGMQVVSNLDLATLSIPECHDSERVS